MATVDAEEATGAPFLGAPPAGARRAPQGAEASGRAASARHLAALLGKNRILKQREWSATCCPWCPIAACCELLFPMLVLALLWWARDECSSGGQCKLPVLTGWGGEMPSGNFTTECTEGLPLGSGHAGYSTCKAWTEHYERPAPFIGLLAHLHWTKQVLALAAAHPADIPKLERMRSWISEHWYPPMELRDIPCRPHDFADESGISRALHLDDEKLPCHRSRANPGVLQGFRNLTHPKIFTSQELEAYLDSPSYGSDGLLFAAVVFDAVGGGGELGAPGAWSYSVRLNMSAGATPYTGGPKTHPLELSLDTHSAMQYLRAGFVTLQLTMDRYIIGVRSGEADGDSLLLHNDAGYMRGESVATQALLAEPLRYLPQGIEAVPMPVTGKILDGFFNLVSVVFPLVFIVAFLYTQKKVLNELIMEKETKVRESLRMLGVRSTAIFGSWYITYGIIFGMLCAVFAAIASRHVFEKSSGVLLFVFFWLWCMAFLAFALFIHSFFNHSRTGGIVGMMVMFVQWIIYASQNKSGPASFELLLLLMVMPNGALCAGLHVLSKFEAAKVGVTWSTITWPVDNNSFSNVIGMMLFDVAFWTLLGWYFDRVMPKEFGARMPLCFPCLPAYWQQDGPPAEGADDDLYDWHGSGPGVCAGRDAVEEVPAAVLARSRASGTVVRARGLRKVFSTPGGEKVAVAGLDLTMYEGQILALLGHNGAGKTTTINMLIGMVEPSGGNALVAGHALSTGLSKIRRLIGVCPQHDVLWPELTVIEHLTIYARLRGVEASCLDTRVQDTMLHVGLAEKARTRAGALSGGQRRKLSLCLALIGRPRVCFLDEPTSGMDPFSRRSTWSMIQGVREDRVIVLTTHFMDEADILGDRIAIMADGVLQCCGSSLFLKNRFGAGYRVTCARSSAATMSPSSAGQRGDALVETILRHVPGAQVLTDVAGELTMRLPATSAPSFAGMFEELDARRADLDLEHYGLSMVTLEEVFLRVASGELGRIDSSAAAAPHTEVRAACAAVEAPGSHVSSRGEGAGAPPRGRSHELGVVARHFASLFLKRARYGRRDYRAIGCTVLLPVALLALGLWLLNRAGARYSPSLPLSVEAQFGYGSPVPYNSTGNGLLGQALAGGAGQRRFSPLPEAIPPNESGGVVFGHSYSEGLPQYRMCDDSSTQGTKCWREYNICERPLPHGLFPFAPPGTKVNFWSVIELLQQTGIGLTCRSDTAGCRRVIKGACAHDAEKCVSTCLDAGVHQISREVCRRQCAQICSFGDQLQEICLVLDNHTVGYFCPERCADAGDSENACPPGTMCSVPSIPNATSPSDILSFALKLHWDGQGRTRQSSRYSGLLEHRRDGGVGTTWTLLYNTSALHSVPAFLNLASSVVKQAVSGAGSSISVTNHPMPRTRNETLDKLISGVVNLTSTLVIIIAFSWIPAAIVAYVVREREAHHNSKHQQLISGVSLASYWLANLAWDTCVFMAPLGLSLICMKIFNIDIFIAHGAIWATALVFLGYGVAISPFSYLMSFAFAKHTTAQILCLVINFLTGLLLLITSYILSAIDNTKEVNDSLMWVYRLFPGFSLGHGLFNICSNVFAEATLDIDMHVDLLSWDIAGEDIAYLFVSSPIYMACVLLIDYLSHSPLAALAKHLDPQVAMEVGPTLDDDEDVVAEEARVATGGADGDVIKITNLRKVYRTPEGLPKVAVHNLSFGLSRGECFGFLGSNGAGKTSTLNMLTGVVLPSGGSATVDGFDCVAEQWKVRRRLGYCPQHDALLDRLTVREHLELFGRIKCIPNAVLKRYCTKMMQDLDLSEHMDKMAMQLSGGNKRKLSLAISMMGSPPLVLLDEPSTGVDPAARRLMWSVISGVSTGTCQCTVVLTTHNMEEAEALCSRIGIMVGGRLRCIGSNQRLKSRFGSGYQLEARLRCPDERRAVAAAEAWSLPPVIASQDLGRICAALGNPMREAAIMQSAAGGHALQEEFEREGAASASSFAHWWLLEDAVDAVSDFLQQNFPGAALLEQQERSLRYRLPATSRLASIFAALEASQAELSLEEYGVSQATLEQIFNGLAARQETAAGL